ncbi:MAG: beta-L-arabinofuranosidase domain-containing protein, partial [Planctomycetota bacterium]
PFSESIKLLVSAPKRVRFPLYLRIPGWCTGTKLKVNGKAIRASFPPLSYAVIERTWANGDLVEIKFPARIAINVWEKNKNSVSVNRGPLTFSLKIGEKWVKYDGRKRSSEKRVIDVVMKWPAYEVYPTTAWNYGLVLDAANAAASFEVAKKRGAVAEQPFTPEDAPIELRAKARKIPEWKMDEQGLVGVLPESPVISSEPIESVTLIPMGCARLRVSAFPTVSTRTDSDK